MKRFALIFAGVLGLAASKGVCAPQPVVVQPIVTVSSVATAGGQAQAIASTPTALSTYSAGYYNYITNIHIEYYAVSTLTGGTTPVTCTTTNLPGNPVFKFPTAEATGVEAVMDMQFANPVQATQGYQAVVTCPATSNVVWNVIIGYFQSN